MRRNALAAVAVALTVGAAGCGDDGGGSVEADGLPQFVSGFAATCTDSTGFEGAAAFEPGPDAVPLAFFTDLDDAGTFFLIDPQLGPEVATTELTDPDDEAERARLGEISLIACLDVASSESSGETCEFEDDGGDTTTLDVHDVTYSLAVHEARTGEEVDTATLEVEGAEDSCPIVMSIDDGQDTYLPSPESDAVLAALEPITGA